METLGAKPAEGDVEAEGVVDEVSDAHEDNAVRHDIARFVGAVWGDGVDEDDLLRDHLQPLGRHSHAVGPQPKEGAQGLEVVFVERCVVR